MALQLSNFALIICVWLLLPLLFFTNALDMVHLLILALLLIFIVAHIHPLSSLLHQCTWCGASPTNKSSFLSPVADIGVHNVGCIRILLENTFRLHTNTNANTNTNSNTFTNTSGFVWTYSVPQYSSSHLLFWSIQFDHRCTVPVLIWGRNHEKVNTCIWRWDGLR